MVTCKLGRSPSLQNNGRSERFDAAGFCARRSCAARPGAARSIVVWAVVAWAMPPLMLLASPMRDGVPRKMSLQGFLEDSTTGLPVNGTVDFCVSIWDKDTGGNKLWPPEPVECFPVEDVEVRSGLFALTFGDDALTPTVFGKVGDGPMPRWIQLSTRKSDGDQYDIMAPRIELRTVPYAFRAGFVDSPELADDLSLGSCDPPAKGTLHLFNGDNPCTEAISLDAGSAAGDPIIVLRNNGTPTVQALAHGTHGGGMLAIDAPTNGQRVQLAAGFGSTAPSSSLRLYGSNSGTPSVSLEGGNEDPAYDNGGSWQLQNQDGNVTAQALGGHADGGAKLHIFNGQPNQETITLDSKGAGGESEVLLRHDASGDLGIALKTGGGGGSQPIISLAGYGTGTGVQIGTRNSPDANAAGFMQIFRNDGTTPSAQINTSDSYGGFIETFNVSGTATLRASGGVDGSHLRLWNGQSPNREVIKLDANDKGDGGPAIHLRDTLGRDTLLLDGHSNGGALFQMGTGANESLHMTAYSGDDGRIQLWNGQTPNLETVLIDGNGGGYNSGRLVVRVSNPPFAHDCIVLTADPPGIPGGEVRINDTEGATRVRLYNSSGHDGTIDVYSLSAPDIARATLNAGDLYLRNTAGDMKVRLAGATGDGTFSGRVTAACFSGPGCDLAESFDHSGAAAAEPGMVMVIDAAHPGQLAVSTQAYDKKVAGIVSGAGGLQPGVVLGGAEPRGFSPCDLSSPDTSSPSELSRDARDRTQEPSRDARDRIQEPSRDLKLAAREDVRIALSGRVYCFVDATNAAVEVGDLLTTSSTPGHAMKVADFARSQGCVLGKAMEPLEKGKKGLVLVLVGLQ